MQVLANTVDIWLLRFTLHLIDKIVPMFINLSMERCSLLNEPIIISYFCQSEPDPEKEIQILIINISGFIIKEYIPKRTARYMHIRGKMVNRQTSFSVQLFVSNLMSYGYCLKFLKREV